MIDEEPHELHVARIGRQMERCPPVLVPGCRVRAMLNEEPRELHMTPNKAHTMNTRRLRPPGFLQRLEATVQRPTKQNVCDVLQ
jgi:hypothetical protein